MHSRSLRIRRTMARNFSLEVAQTRPVQPLIQIDFADYDRAPLLGVGQRATRMVVDRGEHPVARDVFVGAADKVDMVLDGSGLSQQRVTAPDRPCDYLRAV